MNWSKSAGSLARGFSGASFLRRGDENFPCAMVVVSFYRQGIVGADRIRPKADGIARLAEWEQLSMRIVGADRIRPQHKAPLRGACVPGRLLVDPYSRAYAVKRVLLNIQGCGRMLSAPTVGGGNHGVVPFNEVHSLSQPVRAASSLRERAKAAAPQRACAFTECC